VSERVYGAFTIFEPIRCRATRDHKRALLMRFGLATDAAPWLYLVAAATRDAPGYSGSSLILKRLATYSANRPVTCFHTLTGA
jgi:hypothetical protein